ncbi:MAG: C40 family peptidase [Actinomycetota bacterium]|nr:C40 family peptidase [Actinomycetota bacterium]
MSASVLLSLPLVAHAKPQPRAADRTSTSTATASYSLVRASSPARTRVYDASGRLVATFTDGARSVVLDGPARTFAEPSTTSARVTSRAWVRLLGTPFAGMVDLAWLTAALADTSPDLIALGFRYATGAPDQYDGTGTRTAGDASYGPLVDGVRQEGSDWNDYLGISATYGTTTDRPEADQLGALDCSGFVRMTFGRLGGVPMTLEPDGVRLPRRAVQMDTSAPGVLVVRNTGRQVKAFDTLLAGDLVFFDASSDDGTAIDHVGIYLGVDSSGRRRFLSSRKGADGPTMGDVSGRSTLDGTGLYATAFRSVRRL